MSWLSRALGLDSPSNKPLLTTLNTIGSTVLTNVEATNPIATTLVNVLETVGNKDLSKPITAVSAIGTIVAVLDPNFVKQIEAVVDAALTKVNIPALVIADINTLLEAEVKSLGF